MTPQPGTQGHAGFFSRAAGWAAAGFAAGVGLLGGLLFAWTVIRVACVSMTGGFGG